MWGTGVPIERTLHVVMVAAAMGLAGCHSVGVDPSKMEIVEDVKQIPPMPLRRLCVEINTEVKEQFTEGLFDAVRALNLSTQSKQTAFGDECRYWMWYHATWAGFPEYLATAEFRVYDGRSQIGRAVYDARQGSSRLDRYGSAAEKVKPLLEAMFMRVDRGSTTENQ